MWDVDDVVPDDLAAPVGLVAHAGEDPREPDGVAHQQQVLPLQTAVGKFEIHTEPIFKKNPNL